jgi:hypothetical protein
MDGCGVGGEPHDPPLLSPRKRGDEITGRGDHAPTKGKDGETSSGLSLAGEEA